MALRCCLSNHQRVPLACSNTCRQLSAKAKSKQQKSDRSSYEPDPSSTKTDWVGPADKITKLRKYKLYVPPDETALEKSYRLKRQEVHKWSSAFWERHNLDFIKGKKVYSEKLKKDKGLSGEEALSADDMAKYYRSFLNEQHQAHIKYNWEWYKKNISLLWPALLVNLEQLFKKTKKV